MQLNQKGPVVSRATIEVLVLKVGGQSWGILSSDVREVLRAVTVVPLPQAPPIVEGIINVRGTIVPVLDIRARSRLEARPLQHTDHLIVVQTGDRQVAIRADQVVDLVPIPADAIEKAGRALPEAVHVSGVAKGPDGLLLIHDLRTFLQDAEVRQLDEVLHLRNS